MACFSEGPPDAPPRSASSDRRLSEIPRLSADMKIIIPGGSGQVGVMVARAFVADGHDVVVLSRRPTPAPWRVVAWDAKTLGSWLAEIDGADVVINLTGRSVNCRYNAANRREIMASRVDSTRVVGRAIERADRPPRVWLQASTATIYAHRYDAPNDELTGIIGGSNPDEPAAWRFSIEVATAWERAANEAATPNTRKVLLRSAMTMSPDRGGVFDALLGLVRRGLGGTSGDGRQFVSWVHERDLVRAIYWLIERDLQGPVNIASPNPIPNASFMRDLRSAWGTRLGLPANRWMLAIGAFLMRTETELVLKSRRVVPTRLLESGFTFEFPTWPEAATDLCHRWRERER
jgi:uncharacterized protein (TIGR01777 family)